MPETEDKTEQPEFPEEIYCAVNAAGCFEQSFHPAAIGNRYGKPFQLAVYKRTHVKTAKIVAVAEDVLKSLPELSS